MIRTIHSMFALFLVLAILTPVAAAQSIDMRLADGSRWRGEVGDRVEVKHVQQGTEITIVGKIVNAGSDFLMVKHESAGSERQSTLFRGDIRSIRSVTESEGQSTRTPTRRGQDTPSQRQPDSRSQSDAAKGPGVFVLPLTGMVGPRINHHLIEKMVEEADKHGPGQIIILELTTGGGAVVEMEQIARVLLDVKQRHRVVAWVHEAISAGCATAMLCNEIYFSTMGTAGSMTMYSGSTSVSGQELQNWLQRGGEWAEAGGNHRYIAHAMIHAPLMLSYDKDPETGEITYYNDLSGEYILSRPGDNLTLNASNAVHSGFADGIADTTDDLAELLDLPEWREVNDYGRRLHDDWNALVDRAERELPRLMARYQRGTSGDAMENLRLRIRIIEDLLRWWDRAPAAMMYMLGPDSKTAFERELAELRKRLADMTRQQRGAGRR